MSSTGTAAIRLAVPIFTAAFKKIAKRSVRDELVKQAERAGGPRISWRERFRLMSLLKEPPAVAALTDQDDAGEAHLADLISDRVYRGTRRPDAVTLSQALMASFLTALDLNEAIGVVGYKMRRMDASQTKEFHELGQKLDTITTGIIGSRIDSDVLAIGPLQGLNLDEKYRRSIELETSDPAAAAALLSEIIGEAESAGYGAFSASWELKLPVLRERCGDTLGAATAWTVILERGLFSDSPEVSKAIQGLNGLVEREDAPVWLGPRARILSSLNDWRYGGIEASEIIEDALKTCVSGDPLGGRWVKFAVECMAVDGEFDAIRENCARLIEVAGSDATPVPEGVRIRLAVADSTDSEELWSNLVDEAAPGSRRMSRSESALTMARRGRYLALKDKNDAAVSAFRFAMQRGIDEGKHGDAAGWAASAVSILQRSEEMPIGDLRHLNMQIRALRSSGDESFFPGFGNDYSMAIEILVDTTSELRRPILLLRNHLRQCIVLGRTHDEIACRRRLAQLCDKADRLDAAVVQYVSAGDSDGAARVAEKLNKYCDVFSFAAGAQYQASAAAFAVAAAQADLIPDSEVGAWASVALDEIRSQRSLRPIGPSVWEKAYKLMANIARRLPHDVVRELLLDIETMIRREKNTGRRIDRDIARMLIRIGLDDSDLRDSIGANILLSFKQAPDIAEIIANNADSLIEVLDSIRPDLLALADVDGNEYAVTALARIGERSSIVVEKVKAALDAELRKPLAYTNYSQALLGSVSELARNSACLPADDRLRLADFYAEKIADLNDVDENRSRYAEALVVLAPYLPDNKRSELFDSLIELADDPAVSDVNSFGGEHNDPLGFIRFARVAGEARRTLLDALSCLAVAVGQWDLLWHFVVVQLASANPDDKFYAARIAMRVARSGNSIPLQLDVIANSVEDRLRQLAASLLPYYSDYSDDLIVKLAADTSISVRLELVDALQARSVELSSPSIREAVDRLVEDPSYRVRRAAIELRARFADQ